MTSRPNNNRADPPCPYPRKTGKPPCVVLSVRLVGLTQLQQERLDRNQGGALAREMERHASPRPRQVTDILNVHFS